MCLSRTRGDCSTRATTRGFIKSSIFTNGAVSGPVEAASTNTGAAGLRAASCEFAAMPPKPTPSGQHHLLPARDQARKREIASVNQFEYDFGTTVASAAGFSRL